MNNDYNSQNKIESYLVLVKNIRQLGGIGLGLGFQFS